MELCASLRNRLLEEGTSFGFETVASREDKLEFVRKAKEKRYYIDSFSSLQGHPRNATKGYRNVWDWAAMTFRKTRCLQDSRGR